jgi:hypothetical protein
LDRIATSELYTKYFDLVVDLAHTIDISQNGLQHLFQIEAGNGPAHDENLFLANEFKSASPASKVRVRLEHRVRSISDIISAF